MHDGFSNLLDRSNRGEQWCHRKVYFILPFAVLIGERKKEREGIEALLRLSGIEMKLFSYFHAYMLTSVFLKSLIEHAETLRCAL
jgi:hypothetical protein